MPDKQTIERAKKDKAEGKSPSTQAGEFVREEMDHIREGKHGARSPQQAIAIGLSKARRAESICHRQRRERHPIQPESAPKKISKRATVQKRARPRRNAREHV